MHSPSEPQENAHVQWREVLNRDHGAKLLLVCLGVWLHAADSLIVATMMPQIVAQIGGAPYVAWTVGLYEIGSIIAGASSGLIALRLGVRRPMVVASLVFGAGCALSMLAPNMGLLLAGRVLQGLGGGGLTALSFVAAAMLFPTRLTARVMAAISVLWGASAFMGPMIGGLFVTYANWRWGFGFFALQALGLAIWISFRISFDETPQQIDDTSRIPYRRLALLTVGVLMITWAGVAISWPRTPLLIGAGILALWQFLRLDAASGGNRLLPRMPLSLRTPIGAAGLMNLTTSMATMGLPTYGTLLLAKIHATSPIVAGYVLATVSITWTLAAIAVSGAPEKRDTTLIFIGVTMIVASLAGLVWAVPHGPLWLIILLCAIEGAGFGGAWSFVIRRAKRLSAAGEVERLAGSLPTMGRLGYALGAAWCGIWANAAGFALGNSMEESVHVARVLFMANLPLGLLAFVAMLRFVATPTAAPA